MTTHVELTAGGLSEPELLCIGIAMTEAITTRPLLPGFAGYAVTPVPPIPVPGTGAR